MLPRVVLHNAISLDGKNEGFEPDLGQYYGLAGSFCFDVHLAGSNTIVKQAAMLQDESEDDKPFERDPKDTRPLLVVPDSRGRIRRWSGLRKAGFWRDVVVLCSQATPTNYQEYLKERHIDFIIKGTERVDMGPALEELHARYGATTVLLDGGGTLNGVLLGAGLVDELSLLVHPCLVGGKTPRPFVNVPDFEAVGKPIELELGHVEKLEGGTLWLRYKVLKKTGRN